MRVLMYLIIPALKKQKMLWTSIMSRGNVNCSFSCQKNSECITKDETSLMDLFEVVISKNNKFQMPN